MLLKTRHKLIDIAAITLCGVLSGADDWTEIASFGRAKEEWLKGFLELPSGISSHDTFGRVFSKIRPEEFEQCFINWVEAAFGEIAPQVAAIDGKTSRHSYNKASGDHGRVEIRSFTTTDEMAWFEDKSKWEKLTSFGMVETERHLGDKITNETRYYISSLPNNAKQFGNAARGHWGIENGLHCILDVAFREDDSRIRTGHAPTNLGIIRHFALNLYQV